MFSLTLLKQLSFPWIHCICLNQCHIGRWSFTSGAVVKNQPANTGDARDSVSIPGSGTSPGVGKGQPALVFSPGEFQGQSSLLGYSPWGGKESDTTEHMHP